MGGGNSYRRNRLSPNHYVRYFYYSLSKISFLKASRPISTYKSGSPNLSVFSQCWFCDLKVRGHCDSYIFKKQITWNFCHSPGVQNCTEVPHVSLQSRNDWLRDVWLLVKTHTYASRATQKETGCVSEDIVWYSEATCRDPDSVWLHLKRQLSGRSSGLTWVLDAWSEAIVRYRMLIWKGNASQEREPITSSGCCHGALLILQRAAQELPGRLGIGA